MFVVKRIALPTSTRLLSGICMSQSRFLLSKKLAYGHFFSYLYAHGAWTSLKNKWSGLQLLKVVFSNKNIWKS
jgi:hypothetical protein